MSATTIRGVGEARPVSIEGAISQAVSRELQGLTRLDGLCHAHIEEKAPLLNSLLQLAIPDSGSSGYDLLLDLLERLGDVPAVSCGSEGLIWVGPSGGDWAKSLHVVMNTAMNSSESCATLDLRRKSFLPPDSLQNRYNIRKRGSSTIRTKLWPDALDLLSFFVVHLAKLSGNPSAKFFTEDQVELLDWSHLSAEVQDDYFDRFLDQPPMVDIPAYPWAPATEIEKRNEQYPIDLDPLGRILREFNPTAQQLKLDRDSYLHLVAIRSSTAAQIEESIANGLSDAQSEAIYEMYSYLACHAEPLQATAHETHDLDIVIVPGAQRAMTYRVDCLVDRIRRLDDPVIIFTGLGPSSRKVARVPISEADAMFHYLTRHRNLAESSASFVLERRASNTFESLIHSLRTIQEVAFYRGRSLKVGLITNPYHMRRLYLTAIRAFEMFPHLVDRVSCLTASSSIDLKALTTQAEREQDRRAYASLVYLTEYIKLVGGRGTLEF